MSRLLSAVLVIGWLAVAVFLDHAFLSWAEGQKEPVYPPYCWAQPPNSELWYPCDSEELKMADCLNLMELAMKAVDPYMPSLAGGKLSLMSDDEDKYIRILKLWDRAKNSCWSDLKDLQPQHYH